MCKTAASTEETWRVASLCKTGKLFMCSSSSIQSREILLLLPSSSPIWCVRCSPAVRCALLFFTFSISIFFVCLSVCGYRRLFLLHLFKPIPFLLSFYIRLYTSPAHFRDRAPFATGQMFWLQATTVYMANKCTSVVQVKKERKNLYTAG
jgi:hypothetical protein